MFTINTVTVSGNLGSAPDPIADGKGCRFSIAINERIKKGDDWEDYVNWVEITAWGSLAEQMVKQLSKGSQVAINGRLREQRWEKDGNKRSKVGIVAWSFFAPKASESAQFDPSSDVPPDTAGLEQQTVPDDEIPF